MISPRTLAIGGLTLMSGLPHQLVGEFIDTVVRIHAEQTRCSLSIRIAERPLDSRGNRASFPRERGVHRKCALLSGAGCRRERRQRARRYGPARHPRSRFHEIADILLSHGANPDAQSEVRENPLHAAARAGHALVRRLLKAGANARYRTDLGESIFDASTRIRPQSARNCWRFCATTDDA